MGRVNAQAGIGLGFLVFLRVFLLRRTAATVAHGSSEIK